MKAMGHGDADLSVILKDAAFRLVGVKNKGISSDYIYSRNPGRSEKSFP